MFGLLLLSVFNFTATTCNYYKSANNTVPLHACTSFFWHHNPIMFTWTWKRCFSCHASVV